MRLSTIPFSGFYCSMHDRELDYACKNILQDGGGDPVHPALLDRLFDAIDWRAAHEAYARRYAASWCDAMGIVGAEFDELNSPREYNFTTDRIFIRIPDGEVTRILASIDRARLDETARAMFTTRDGFISSYSPRVEDWGPVSDWDHNQLGCMLAALQPEEFDEWDIVENWSGNGVLEGWILNTPAAIHVTNLAWRIRRMRGEC
jgi:hypothetical protein